MKNILLLFLSIAFTVELYSNPQEVNIKTIEYVKVDAFAESGNSTGPGFISIPGKIEKYYSDEMRKRNNEYFHDLIKDIVESNKLEKLLIDHPILSKKWIDYHKPLLKLKMFKDNYQQNPAFYATLSQAMIETRNYRNDLFNIFKNLDEQTKKKLNSPFDASHYGSLFSTCWLEQKGINATKGLVEAHLTWMLCHVEKIFFSYEQDLGWGGMGGTLTRGLICSPDEVIKVVSNPKILDRLPIEVVQYIPELAKDAMSRPIGERIGDYKKGKVVKNSPEIEKRRKIAKEKYLPQINKIIADYLKDKKADK